MLGIHKFQLPDFAYVKPENTNQKKFKKRKK